MVASLPEVTPAEFASEARAFWQTLGLPPSTPVRSPPAGSITLVVGTLIRESVPSLATLERLVAADVAARALRLSGKSVVDPLFLHPGAGPSGTGEFVSELANLGVWFGQADLRPTLGPELAPRIQSYVQTMAERGLVSLRQQPSHMCPYCGERRSPERTIYRSRARPTYLVRFPLAGTDPAVSALVWTDALWKVLATEALLVHPDRPYVRATFRRHGQSEEVFISRRAVDRLPDWRPNCELEVHEERPGSQWAGRAYQNPLAAEMPTLAELSAPSGTVLPWAGLKDSGTGFVPLTPAHGPADWAAAPELGVPVRNVLAADGTLLESPPHKYSRLPLDTAEACIARDLADDGRIFEEFRVRSGVPTCAVCGTELVWRPGPVWSLDLERISPRTRERFARLNVRAPFPDPPKELPWPVSSGDPTEDPGAPELAECESCGRLAPPPGPPTCPCGAGAPALRRRQLLPILAEPLAMWSRLAPLPLGAIVWFVLPFQRRVPVVLHQLLAMEVVGAHPAESRLTLLDTRPSEGSSEALADPPPPDALRAALLRLASGTARRQTLAQAIVEETHRIHRLWSGARTIVGAMVRDGFEPDGRAITSVRDDLLPEDRAFLACFERMRAEVLRSYDRGEWSEGYRALGRFLDRTVRELYLPLLLPRLSEPGLTPSKVAAYRVWGHVIPRLSEAAAPVLPHFAEVVHRSVDGDAASVFQQRFAPIQESLLDPAAEAALERWGEVVRAVRVGLRRAGVGAHERLAQVVLVLPTDEEAAALDPHVVALGRLLRADRVTLASPARPWAGRKVEARPNAAAIKQAFPAYHRRILSVLGQMDGRRLREALRTQTLAVALEGGMPIRIPSAMVEVTESLPEGFVPVHWRSGEAIVELARPGQVRPSAGPVFGPDVERVRRHLHRRWRRITSAALTPSKLFVWAEEPLRGELQRAAPALARSVGGASVLVVDSPRLFAEAETTSGRGRRGVPFSVWVPGVPPPLRGRKRRARRSEERMVRIAAPDPRLATRGEDFLTPESQQRTEAVRTLLAELEGSSAVPFLSTAKLRGAYEGGFRSRAELASADVDELAGLPGFGPILARELLQALAPERSLPELPPLYRAWAPVDPPTAPIGHPASETGGGSARSSGPATLVVPPALPEISTVPAAPTPTLPVTPTPAPLVHPPIPPPPAAPPPAPRPAPDTPRVSAPALPPPPPPAGVFVRSGPNRDESWDAFLAAIGGGAGGLWVGRLFPRSLQASSAQQEVRFLWLSTTERPNSVRPGDLPALLTQVERALREERVSAVLIEEVEYLVAVNGVELVRGFLAALLTRARERGARIWVPVVPGLVGATNAERLVSFESDPSPSASDRASPSSGPG